MTSTTTASDRERIIDLLGRVLFRDLPREDIERIARLVRRHTLAKGEVLFREGDTGDRFYIVYSGAVEVLKDQPRGEPERLAVKRAGEAFGEMSLLDDAPRSASIRAVEPTELLFLTREEFDELLGGESLALRIMRGLARALRSLDVRFAARTGEGEAAEAMREFGRVVQRGLLPHRVPPVDGYEVAAATVPGRSGQGEVLWDAVRTPDGAVVLAMFEVRGTGLPPAYLLAVARALFRQIARTEPDFGQVLPRLNEALADNLFEGLDECVEVGLLRFGGDGAAWSGAGDQPVVIIRGDGELEELQPHGPPLGILPQFDFGTTALPLESGDIVFLLSRAEKGVVRGAGDLIHQRRDESPRKLVKLLERGLARLEGGTLEHDVTLTLARRA